MKTRRDTILKCYLTMAYNMDNTRFPLLAYNPVEDEMLEDQRQDGYIRPEQENTPITEELMITSV